MNGITQSEDVFDIIPVLEVVRDLVEDGLENMELHAFGPPTKSELATDPGAVLPFLERFDRRGTKPFELFRSEFGHNSFKIQECPIVNSKFSEFFNIF